LFRCLAVTSFAALGLLIMNVGHRPPPLRGGLDLAQTKLNTELKADAGGHFITRADIEGATLNVLVDTGASAVALSYEDADRAGLHPLSLRYDVPVATANGLAQAARVTLRRVEIDRVLVRDVDGLVLPQGAMNGTLLGMSFLSRLRSFKVEDGVLTLED
jgi:aspartyl protease family protein